MSTGRVTLPDVLLDLEQLVSQKVKERLAGRNGELKALVARAVNAEVDWLVSEFLEAELGQRARDVERPTPTKTCRRCGEAKPLDRFHAGKSACKACRAREDRERKARRRQVAEAPSSL
jgi:ribosomal protein L37E